MEKTDALCDVIKTALDPMRVSMDREAVLACVEDEIKRLEDDRDNAIETYWNLRGIVDTAERMRDTDRAKAILHRLTAMKADASYTFTSLSHAITGEYGANVAADGVRDIVDILIPLLSSLCTTVNLTTVSDSECQISDESAGCD